jgi:hypothetical protein
LSPLRERANLSQRVRVAQQNGGKGTMSSADTARSPLVTNEDRGRAIERRAAAMGIYTSRPFEEMSEKVDRKIPRAQYAKAIRGEASDRMFTRIEDALTLMEQRTGHDEPSNGSGPLRLVLHNVYGIGEIIAEGGDAEEVSEAVTRLVRKLREQNETPE